MLDDLQFGNYAETVIQLQERLNALVKPDNKLKVVVVGHGGRDCWISLLLVEAVATNKRLRTHVQIVILSCTWPGDRWEKLMNEYLAPLTLFVNFVKFQFHRDHHTLVQDLSFICRKQRLFCSVSKVSITSCHQVGSGSMCLFHLSCRTTMKTG